MTDPQLPDPYSPERTVSMQKSPSSEETHLSAEPVTEQDFDSRTFIGGELQSGTTGMRLSAADKVGKYQIRGMLGEGGMGAVYLAFDPLIEREVALKMLTQDAGDSSIALQRFLGEARSIGKLNHPNIVSIYDIDQWQGRFYIVMELLSGGSVASLTDKHGALSWENACQLVSQAARGLAAAHRAGLIHRDIKPENLMLNREGVVKVVDFGLSKLIDAANDPRAAVTRAGQILGTPQYMSPEQFEAENIDARTDIYSLGATLFRLLTAHFPYHECRSILQVMTAHLSRPAPVPSELIPTLPVELNRIIARAMAKSPADRYESAEEFADELESLIAAKKRVPSEEDRTAVDDVYPLCERRTLEKVVILEPSRLQGVVLRDSIKRSGVDLVEVLQTVEAAKRAIELDAPDLLITAMELPDGRGIDLLKELCGNSKLRRTCVVLNSNDSTINELIDAGPAACLILAPKKVRPEDILRIVHAAGPCQIEHGPFPASNDPSAVSVKVELDGGRIPGTLATILRELQLLNVEVTRLGEAVTDGNVPASLTLLVCTAKTAPKDDLTYAAVLSNRPQSFSLTSVVQLEHDKVWLRAVHFQGILAVCHCLMDSARMLRLVQACRV